MSARLSPQAALYGGDRPLPALPACVHYAGRRSFLDKALALQAESGSVFDIAADCEDGAPVGDERGHALMVAAVIAGDANRQQRMGARVHPIRHPAALDELDVLVGEAGDRLAFLTCPKAESAGDVERFLEALALRASRTGLGREIPVSVMVETHGAVRDAWSIAALAGVVSLDFGTLDFVSAHHGAIPAAAMDSPGQFDHPLLRRAKCETAAAALAHAVVPVHGVTRALERPAGGLRRRPPRARRVRIPAHVEHPSVADRADPAARCGPLPRRSTRRPASSPPPRLADWAPVRAGDTLHDRASYRYCWTVLQRAHASGTPMPAAAAAFFPSPSPLQ